MTRRYIALPPLVEDAAGGALAAHPRRQKGRGGARGADSQQVFLPAAAREAQRPAFANDPTVAENPQFKHIIFINIHSCRIFIMVKKTDFTIIMMVIMR